MSQDFEVLADKTKLILALLFFGACGAYAARGLFLLPPGDVSFKYSIIFADTHQAFIFVLAVMVPALFFTLKALLDPRPIVVINADGILDRRHFKSVILWSGITGMAFNSIKVNFNTLDVWMLELTAAQKTQTRFTLAYHLNKYFYTTPNPNIVCLHLNGLDCNFDELEAAVNEQRVRRRAAPQQRYGGQSRRLFG